MMVGLIVFIDKCDLYATYRPYRSFRPRSIDFINITHSPFQPLSVPAMFHHHGNEAHGPSQRLYGPWSQHQGHMHLTPLRPLSRPEGPHTVPLGRSEEHTSELQSLMRISYAV